MNDSLSRLSRRQLLQVAGGITYLAILPDGRVAFAAEPGRIPKPLPVFKALPYLQPGSAGGPLRDGAEAITLAWETNRVSAQYTVLWGEKGKWTGGPSEPLRTERYNSEKEDGKSAFHYAVPLTGLALNTRYEYQVQMDGKTLATGFFTTRKSRGKKCRFVSFGDNSYGDIHERMIAYQAFKARPDFVMNTGDNAYEDGLGNEYTRYFFPVYNSDIAEIRIGAPLLRSFPFYTVLGNHDYNASDDKGPFCDFDKDPDSLGYFQCLHLPLNGVAAPTHPIPIRGKEVPLGIFQKAAGDRYPRMANYSFDYADAHFLCLDSNTYVDPNDKKLQEWIAADLAGTDAVWKFVTYHHPAFNAGQNHFRAQHMRVLTPIFEKYGVAVVLSGHEHVYQRSRPLRFTPTDISRASAVGTSNRVVPGNFAVDTKFDGIKNTRPDGILYLITGAAGKYLYNPDMNENPEKWAAPLDGNLNYVARYVCDRHSLTVFDMDATSLTFFQIDQWGNEIDRCRITRP